MDDIYYSDKTISQFLITDLCQRDKILYKYYVQKNISKFRKRFSKKFNDVDLEKIIYTVVTDHIRDIILDVVSNLTVYLQPMGDLVVTGGEAFNTYFDRKDRIPTSDIDTKFLPIDKKPGSGQLIGPRNPLYFEYLQATKLILWDKLGEISKKMNEKISKRINILEKTFLGRLLGLGLGESDGGINVTRRYTLMPKKRQNLTKNEASAKNVLIDVELFAIDLKIRRFSFDKGRVVRDNLGGILDIAVMRPFEVGYEVVFSRDQGHAYYNPITKKLFYNKNLLIAGKKFLIEDLFLMKSLGLRPHKVKKDHKRMYTFSKIVLGVKNIKSTDSDVSIFRKAIKKVPKTSVDIKKRPVMSNRIIEYAKTINPLRYEVYTTEPIKEKLAQRIIIGVKAPRNISIKNYYRTSGIYRFNIGKRIWVLDPSSSYIKNEFTHRPEHSKVLPKVYSMKRILYGYHPIRNRKVSDKLINSSAMIPLVGLKNKNFLVSKR
jgi:hypothetical protein